MEPLGTFESRLPLKAIIIALLAVAAIFWAVGCAPPHDPAIHGRAAFDAWLTENGVRQETRDLSAYPGAPCGAYLIVEKLAATDPDCIIRATTDPQALIWIPIHEAGHSVDRALDFPQGGTAVGVERGAQCVAAVVLGWSYAPAGMEEAGYWSCPLDQVDRTRILMEALGAW